MSNLFQVWTFMLAFDGGRYLVVAGAAFLGFWVWGRARFSDRLVRGEWAPASAMRREVLYSISTAAIFAAVGTLIFVGTRAGILDLYMDAGAYGWPYWVVSIAVLVILQDAYFYWTHRAMHHPWLFRRVHRVHHLSHNPSPWAAYAFAPPEALVHALFVPLVLLVMPVHQLALFAFLGIMIARNVLGHLGIELFPVWFVHRRRWRWSTTTTHHGLHHARVRTNFGLYFTWWDRAMGTTDPTYEATFDAIVTRSLGADQLRMQVADAMVARVDVRGERALGVTTPERVDVDPARRVRDAVAGGGVLRRRQQLHGAVVAEPVVQRVGQEPRASVAAAAGDRSELLGIDGDEVVHATEQEHSTCHDGL
jgi:sterol desaturase/sphingolipid hydroxylase (fatty acid hydroxylase superfamily)